MRDIMEQTMSQAIQTVAKLREDAYEKFFKKCLEIPDLDVFTKEYVISQFDITAPISEHVTIVVHKESGRRLVVQEPRFTSRVEDSGSSFLDIRLPVYEYGIDGAEVL
jgi:hypothetical protein